MAPSFEIIIPARFSSERLPGKALRDICGKPLIQRVYECAIQSSAELVTVATDDDGYPVGCMWDEYDEDDWAYGEYSTIESCAEQCESLGNCNGFEYSDVDNYCSFWLDGACDLLGDDLPNGYFPVWTSDNGEWGWLMYVFTGECDCNGNVLDCEGDCGGDDLDHGD